jgi:uncharacterized surface protein with fasciclin (FAS1) repeats
MKVRILSAVVLAVLVGAAVPHDAPAADTASIYDTLALMKDHSILSVAVTEAKEAPTLRGPGPYCLFAPTDAAFKKLDDATIKKLATDKETVKQLLQAHLVKGKLTAVDLKTHAGKDLSTLQGGALKVEDTKDGLRVGGAKVVTDVRCSNGVIHVIDAVLPGAK